jgi:hypothetical protein
MQHNQYWCSSLLNSLRSVLNWSGTAVWYIQAIFSTTDKTAILHAAVNFQCRIQGHYEFITSE